MRRVTRLSPGLVRVTVGGDDLASFRWPGPAGHLKLMLPEPGAADVVLPEPDGDGAVAFVPGAMPTMRTYTARSFDEATRELDIDLVLHGAGPAAHWAARAAVGDRVAVTVPRAAGFVEDPAADWLLLAGDASALPALATIIPLLTRPSTVLVECPDPVDLGPTVTWVDDLEKAVLAATLPPGRGQVWVAGEAGVIRRLRTELLPRLSRDQLTTRGYWRAGAVNHPDHDYGDD